MKEKGWTIAMNLTQNQVGFKRESVSKEEAIQAAGEILLKKGLIEEPYIQSMLEKELTDVTYIGNGIAIPHGLNKDRKYVKESGISVVHYPNGIQYDEYTAYIIIGIAGDDREQLSILQKLAIRLFDENCVSRLVKANTINEFLEIFNDSV